MKKIFSQSQIRAIDTYTITHEPVSPHGLMERASSGLTSAVMKLTSRQHKVLVFCGTGNNGGDGLAVARMLKEASYQVSVFVIDISPVRTPEWSENLKLLSAYGGTGATMISESSSLPEIEEGVVVIDAIFGSGLNRPPEGIAAETISLINRSGVTVISIDVPSGLAGDGDARAGSQAIVKATHTLAIQFPRLAFMFSENFRYTGEWQIVPIGLHPVAIAQTVTPYTYTDAALVNSFLRRRSKFDHKGTCGHALLIAGSEGKMGAGVLSARAVMRSGAGLLTCHVPRAGHIIMQVSVPEAMTLCDREEHCISDITIPEKCNAVGIGPGIGTSHLAAEALNRLTKEYKGRLVIDADGLNILSMNPSWIERLPADTILTPHHGEFARLAGESHDGFERLQKQISFSERYGCIVILKGAYTSISLPDGKVYFNSTGNPGMATAGSGDALTGVILGLLAQGYEPGKAAITGVYLHGLAGDVAAAGKGQESLIASDIIDNLAAAYTKMNDDRL
jgi:ADP-dependent NAD(P)H-hydrate dehydratase / NAD(P)H-hydrate epimerase